MALCSGVVLLFVPLFVCRLKAYLSGTGVTGSAVLAAMSGWSAAGPVRPVPDILLTAGGGLLRAIQPALTC